MKQIDALRYRYGRLVAVLLAIVLAVGVTSAVWARGEDNVVSANDADGDRIVDTVDVDDDNDGILDVIEIAGNGLDVDTDGDGVPDRLDLDSDNDGVLDWHESGAVFSIDFSGLRVVSGRILGEVGENGLHDALETSVDSGELRYSLSNIDAPADDLPDVIDLDSDNDGLPDMIEAGIDASFDNDGDARIDISAGSVGIDGIADRLQTTNDTSCCDVNGDGVEDTIPRNSDGGDFPDFRDLDSDNDGVFDLVEAGGSDFDRDGRVDNFFDSPVLDGMDDALLSIPMNPQDVNGNGVADHIDPFAQSGTPGPAEQPSNVPQPDAAQQNTELSDPASEPSADGGGDETGSVGRDPAERPGANVLAEGPVDDDPGGFVQTGLNAGGCSIQSKGIDLMLLLLSVLSITVLGWRYTVKRIRTQADH